MDVEEAIRSRRSIRAFTKQTVSKEKIEKALSISHRSPSGTNTQPWHAYVCAGTVRDSIVKDVCELFDSGQAHSYAEYDYYPEKWNELHTSRRRKIGWDLYGLVGIQKGDRKRTAIQARRNYCFFDAPVGIFFTTDAYLGKGSWSDVGLYMQTVMLAARGEEVVSNRHKVGDRLYHLTDVFGAVVSVTGTVNVNAMPPGGRRHVNFAKNEIPLFLSFMTQPFVFMLREHRLERMKNIQRDIPDIKRQTGGVQSRP